MRTAPLNFVIVAAIGVSLWVATAFATAGYLGDNVALNSVSISDFLLMYRIALAIAAVGGLAGTMGWLFYGGQADVALALPRARRVWTGLWFTELLVAAGAVVLLMLQLIMESLTASNLVFMFLMMSVHTWLFFWLSSLVFSPRTVQRIPWFS